MAIRLCILYAILLICCAISTCFTQDNHQNEIQQSLRYEDEGRFVFAYDDIFPAKILQSYYSLASMGNIEGMISPWQYSYEDYYFKIRVANSSSNIPWISPIEQNFFASTKIWHKIKSIAGIISGGKTYYPRDVFISMVRRLDYTTIDLEETADDELTARLLLAPRVQKNDYGETVFYKINGELLAAVFPRYGRLLIWNSTIQNMYKPPAMSYLQGLYSITIRLTTSQDKMEKSLAQTKKALSSVNQYNQVAFPLTDGPPLQEKNPADHMTRRVQDSKGREIAYFDGLMPKGDLDALRLFLLHYNTAYAYQGYDESSDTEHDNVSWIVAIKVAQFVQSRLWKQVNSALEYMSGKSGWYPYDVSMNVIRSSHYTRIHEDCEPHEDEYTILMYLTPDWKAEYYGETAFFEEVFQTDGEPFPNGQRQYSWLASVRPRYGRIVIFRGIIPHSARPPSSAFTGARYTFACKVSRTYQIAHAKMLRETIEDTEPGDEDYELATDLLDGRYNQPTTHETIEFLQKELERRRKKRADRLQEMKESFVKELTF